MSDVLFESVPKGEDGVKVRQMADTSDLVGLPFPFRLMVDMVIFALLALKSIRRIWKWNRSCFQPESFEAADFLSTTPASHSLPVGSRLEQSLLTGNPLAPLV